MVASPEPDPARPTPAGIYDYLLGGQHYSAADQAAAEQAMALTPATRTEVIENRAFLRRAVRYLASRGITQYVDLGSGYPAAGFLAGFDLVPPGLVTTVEWGTGRPPPTGAGAILAAVATVP